MCISRMSLMDPTIIIDKSREKIFGKAWGIKNINVVSLTRTQNQVFKLVLSIKHQNEWESELSSVWSFSDKHMRTLGISVLGTGTFIL